MNLLFVDSSFPPKVPLKRNFSDWNDLGRVSGLKEVE